MYGARFVASSNSSPTGARGTEYIRASVRAPAAFGEDFTNVIAC